MQITYIASSSPTHLFIPKSIHSNLLKHFISRTFTFLLSALLIPHESATYNAVGTITPSYTHFLAFIHNPLAKDTFQRSPSSIPLSHSVYQISFTSSIVCHLRPQVLKKIHFL